VAGERAGQIEPPAKPVQQFGIAGGQQVVVHENLGFAHVLGLAEQVGMDADPRRQPVRQRIGIALGA
jgi:hypothetical protein